MVKIKENITSKDIANMTEMVASFVIFKREDGSIAYMPYYFNDAVKIAVMSTIVEGIDLENIDNLINEDNEIVDEEVRKVVDSFVINDVDDVVIKIENYAYDLINLRKEEYLANGSMLNDHLVKALAKENALNDMLLEIAKRQAKVLSQEISANEKQEEILSKMSEDDLVSLQTRLANGELDMSGMVNEVVAKYIENDKSRDEKYKEIIDEKNKKITELSKYKTMYDARNVLMDDGK